MQVIFSNDALRGLGATEPGPTIAEAWRLVALDAGIPPDTRYVELILAGERRGGPGTDNHAYFDALDLRGVR